MANYYIALAEVNEILNYVENKYISKIPTDFFEMIRTYKSEPCNFKYDITKSLSEQECHKETLELLSYINYKPGAGYIIYPAPFIFIYINLY